VSRAIALAAVWVLALLPAPARAQAFLDQGVLTIARAGTDVGREEFAVRATPGSLGRPGVLAVATDTYRDRVVRTALELTQNRRPASYQVDVSVAGRVVERLTGQLGRGRFAVRLANQSGETVREFPVPAQLSVLDDEAFEQYAFLPRPQAGSESTVNLLLPRASSVVTGTLRAAGTDTLLIGRRPVAADHYVLRLPGGDSREFWCSPGGDLLKVEVPGRALTATRTAPPRH
jgi:hypothetical protein